MKNKKGSVRDVLFIVVIAFGLVIGSLLALKVMNTINDQFQANSGVSVEAKTTMNTINDRLSKWIDGAFLLFWVLFIILGMFLAFQIQSNPVFFPISIIYFIFLIFLSKLFSSIYTTMATSASLSTQAGLLSIIPFVMTRLPLFSFIFGSIIIGLMVIRR